MYRFDYTLYSRNDTWNLIQMLRKLTTLKQDTLKPVFYDLRLKCLIPSVINLGTCTFKYYICKDDLLIQTSIQVPIKPFARK